MLYVVDDAADYRFLVQQVFNRFLPQYSMRLFADGLDLMQHIDQRSNESKAEPTTSESIWPSLIVLDMDMPRLNGFQTLERLKHYPRWESIPVVIMSHHSDSALAETAYKQGAQAYLTKPLHITDLQKVMGQLCYEWLNADETTRLSS